MTSPLKELHLAVRSLARHPGFTAVAVLTIAMGIAVNATMFSVVDGVLLRPLGYHDPDRLVSLSLTVDGAPVQAAFPEIFDIRDQAKSFSVVVADKPITGNITGGDQPERIEVRGVTGGFFPMLGTPALRGRVFTQTDETPGIAPIGVISYGLWQRRFGADPQIIGRSVRIDDDDYSIIGVMPPGFVHPGGDPARPVDFWFPTGFSAEPFPPLNRWWRTADAYARLAPGVSPVQAEEELRRLLDRWRSAYPDNYPTASRWELQARPLRDLVLGDARRPLTLLFGAVGLVLLIACANVAGLQLARQAGRSQEIALRQALGAGRWQVIRPVLAESVVISLSGAVLGVVLSVGGVRLVKAMAPVSLPRAAEAVVDLRVLGFAVLVASITGILFGLAPALATSRLRLSGTMSGIGRGSPSTVASARLRSGLVVVELALALTLLSGAGLMIRSLARLHQIETGFRSERLLTMEITVPYPNDVSRAKYIQEEPRTRFYSEVLRRIRAEPGVADAAMTGSLPLAGAVRTAPITAEGAPATTEAEGPRFQMTGVSDRFFETMGISLISGREFTPQDDASRAPVAIVSASAAGKLWPGTSPLGKRFKTGSTTSEAPWVTVVGVVGDVRYSALEEASPGQLYVSSLQNAPRPVYVVIQARGAPLALAETIGRTVRSVESDQPVYAVRTMDQILAGRVEGRRFAMVCLMTFSLLAIVLSAVGLYGVISYTVTQRRWEIGVRMALGSTPGAILWLILGGGLRLAALGAGLGLIGVLLSGRLMTGLLYGVSSGDPITLALTVAGILGVALLASLVPGRRAARVDPIVALRQQ